MPVWHWISGMVGTIAALVIAFASTHAILRQARELKALARLKEDLTHMIVHDMRGSLTAIRGATWVTNTALGQQIPAPVAELLELAHAASLRLSGMVDNMLDIARMEAGHSIVERAPTSAALLANEATVVARVLARDKDIDLQVELGPAIPGAVSVDAEKLRRVIENLLINAVKFTPVGGHVVLQLDWDERAQALVITVNDSGMGIPAAHLGRIFDKFHQVGVKEPRAMASSGLGLTFCRMVALAHGGSVAAESPPEGGARFIVRIPVPECSADTTLRDGINLDKARFEAWRG